MKGHLGNKLFPDLVRHLSKEQKTGRLNITHAGEALEIFFESGVPRIATTSLADHQMECRLVRDGLATAEQIKAAWLGTIGSSRKIEELLVEQRILSAETVEQVRIALSRSVIELAFELYSGEYEFIDGPSASVGPEIDWTANECLLSGARHASSCDAMLDVIAPEYTVVGPAPEADLTAHSLSSVEGYVLSCIQSPVTIWEAGSMTGLSHVETRRAISVLISLRLVAAQRTAREHQPDPCLETADQDATCASMIEGNSAEPKEAEGPEGGPNRDVEVTVQADRNASECASLVAVTEDPAASIQWCPVEYASASHAAQEQVASQNSKSLAVAIQELNMRVRLAAPSALQRGIERPLAPAEISNEHVSPVESSNEHASQVEISNEPEHVSRVESNPSAGDPLAPNRAEAPDHIAASLPRRDEGGDQRFLKKIIRKLDARLEVASDHYKLLGVDRLASNGSITKSYEEMLSLYEGYRIRWPEDRELQSKIEALTALVKQAYETLGDVEKRRVYDLPLAKEQPRLSPKKHREQIDSPEPAVSPTAEPPQAATAQPSAVVSPRARKKAASSIAAGSRKRNPSNTGAADPDGFQPDLRNPYEAAEEYYKRGRALYERMDFHTAAHLLREAIKLDPNRSSYYYQLGVVLSTLSQARKEHKHHKGCHVTCRLGGFLTRNQRVRREAERHLLKANELDPSNPEIKLRLGLLYKEASLDQKSQQFFYEALILDGTCELARLELGLDREGAFEPAVSPTKKRKPGRRGG